VIKKLDVTCNSWATFFKYFFRNIIVIIFHISN
jgi:hypothetical protein